MMNNIHDFICRVEGFAKCQASEMIDYFAYYLMLFGDKPTFKPKDIQMCFETLKIPAYSNIPRYLSDNSKSVRGKTQKYIKKESYYSMTLIHRNNISDNVINDIPRAEISNVLRDLIPRLTNESEKMYLDEAIRTFEVEAYRASIIMVWLLTLDHLFEYILATKIADFVTALRRAGNNKSIHSKDDFGDIKESQFIEICKSASIINNDVRKILSNKLDIRNSYAHPSTVHLPKSKALEFIEDLVVNVILKY